MTTESQNHVQTPQTKSPAINTSASTSSSTMTTKTMPSTSVPTINSTLLQPQCHHQDWWDGFEREMKARATSIVTPDQQRSWNSLKREIYLQTATVPSDDPYGFTSAGPTPNPPAAKQSLRENYQNEIRMGEFARPLPYRSASNEAIGDAALQS
jgi:hypothetical protein